MCEARNMANINLAEQERAEDFKVLSPCVFAASRGPDYINLIIAHEEIVTIQPQKGYIVIDAQLMLTPNNARLMIAQLQQHLNQMGGVVVDE